MILIDVWNVLERILARIILNEAHALELVVFHNLNKLWNLHIYALHKSSICTNCPKYSTVIHSYMRGLYTCMYNYIEFGRAYFWAFSNSNFQFIHLLEFHQINFKQQREAEAYFNKCLKIGFSFSEI